MSTANEVGEVIGGAISSNQSTQTHLGDRPEIYTYLRSRTESIEVFEITADIYTQPIHNGVNDSFILGHPTNGVLGIANGVGGNQIVLGDYRGTQTVSRIINPFNTYRERFNNDTFKDATTTADWATIAGTCRFTVNEIAVSEIIALNDETYTQVNLVAEGTNLTNLTFEVRFDGSNWETITNNTTLTSAYPSSVGIEWKATAGATQSNQFALDFPIGFAGAGQLTLIKLIYS